MVPSETELLARDHGLQLLSCTPQVMAKRCPALVHV